MPKTEFTSNHIGNPEVDAYASASYWQQELVKQALYEHFKDERDLRGVIFTIHVDPDGLHVTVTGG